MVDRLGRRDVERAPAGVGEAFAEIAFVVVDEELRVEPPISRPLRSGPSGRGLAQSTRRVSSPCFDGQARVERARRRKLTRPGKAPAQAYALRRQTVAPRRPARFGIEGRDQRPGSAGPQPESSFKSRQ